VITPLSIDRLYAAFADVPKPKKIDYCPCCMTSEGIATLLSLPVNEIPEDLIGEYGGNAFHTVGDAVEYHYFFPRLLELVAAGSGFWPDWEVIMGNLKRASWGSWPQEQQNTIISIVDAHFDGLMARQDEFSGFDIEEVLCGVSCSGLPLDPYLQKLELLESVSVFESFVTLNADIHSTGKLQNAFWEEVPDAEAELLDWLKKDTAKRVLEKKLGMTFD